MVDQKSLMEENSNINWFIVFYVCFVFLSMVAIRDVIDIPFFSIRLIAITFTI